MTAALVLTGGGARAAYQAGVLKGIVEVTQTKINPFSIISGSSAGAINASFLAAGAHDFTQLMKDLETLWKNANSGWVFDLSLKTISKLTAAFAKDFLYAYSFNDRKTKNIRFLMDTLPLKTFVEKQVNFPNIRANIQKGLVDALVITATHYATASTVHFIETCQPIEAWHRFRRKAHETKINHEHVIASSAIPLFFAPQLIEGEYYGDGSVRNVNPLSPAIHLGAQKLLVVGVRNYSEEVDNSRAVLPTFSRIFSIMLNALFLDAVDSDLERLRLNNKICRDVCEIEDRHIKPIEVLYLHPSKDLSEIAYKHMHHLPKSLKKFLLMLGSLKEASPLASFLLFDQAYCQELIDLGYQDALSKKEAIENFFNAPQKPTQV